MAFGKFSLFWLVVVLYLMSVIKSNGIRHERSYPEEEEEDENDRFIFKKERGWKRVDAEAGHIRIIPFFRERTSRTASPLHNYELNSIEMDPNSLLVPHYITADLYMYVYEGKGRIGWVHNKKLVEQDLEAGQIYNVPKGSLLYLINRDKNQRLHIFTLLLNENQLIHPHRHHEAFFVAGGQNPQTLFSAFRRETLAAAFGTDNRELEKVLSKQDRGAIVSMGKEQQGKEQKIDDDLLSWPWSSSKKHESSAEEKPLDLQKKKADFSNDNGQYIKADHKSFRPLKRQNLAITLTKINQGKMTAPHWHDHADAISMVLRGRGRVEIVRPEPADSRQRGRGRGREREREEEGEEEREEEQGREREEEREMERERDHESERETESYKRVEAELNPGDGFLVPAGYPSVQISNSEESFEILTFLINNEHNDINFLTGKNSALREIKDEVLAVSMDEKEQELKKVLEAQKDERFLRGPKESQRISSIV